MPPPPRAGDGQLGSLRTLSRARTLRVRSARTAPVASVVLKPGHVQPVWAGHPWVFAQAVDRIEGGVQAGDEVQVTDARGQFLGRGLYSPGSALPVRIYTRNPDVRLDAAFFTTRIERALRLRQTLGLPSADTNAFRLIHAEGDELPGLIVDQLGDCLAVQMATIGIKHRQDQILDILMRLLR